MFHQSLQYSGLFTRFRCYWAVRGSLSLGVPTASVQKPHAHGGSKRKPQKLVWFVSHFILFLSVAIFYGYRTAFLVILPCSICKWPRRQGGNLDIMGNDQISLVVFMLIPFQKLQHCFCGNQVKPCCYFIQYQKCGGNGQERSKAKRRCSPPDNLRTGVSSNSFTEPVCSISSPMHCFLVERIKQSSS